MDKIGDRVKLVFCSDPYTKIPPGTLGTIQIIDSLGTLHVKWDNGAHLGLVPGQLPPPQGRGLCHSNSKFSGRQ